MSNALSDLTGNGQRTRIHNDQIVLKLPQAARALVKTAADAQGVSVSTVVRHAIAEYLERRGYKG